MSEIEAHDVAECEALEQAWSDAKNVAVEKQELMLLTIKTHLGGMGPAPSRHDYDVIRELWHHEYQCRGELDEFINHFIG